MKKLSVTLWLDNYDVLSICDGNNIDHYTEISTNEDVLFALKLFLEKFNKAE